MSSGEGPDDTVPMAFLVEGEADVQARAQGIRPLWDLWPWLPLVRETGSQEQTQVFWATHLH